MMGGSRCLLVAAVAVVLGAIAVAPVAAETGKKRSIYLKGVVCGLPHSAPDVAELLPKAQAGDPVSQHLLASKYRLGLGIPKDPEKAAKWMRRAAEQGYVEAEQDLGGMYMQGSAVQRNIEKALYWLRRAGRKGHACAQTILGFDLLNGSNDVPVNVGEAVEWLHLAAEQKSGWAHRLLASYYDGGYGNAPDKVRALKWAIVAERYRPTNEQVREFRVKLEKKIPAAEAAEGSRRAAAWFAAHPD